MDTIEIRTDEEMKRDGKAHITYCHIRDDGTRVESPIPFYDLKYYFAGKKPFNDQIIESKRWYSKMKKPEKDRIIEEHRQYFLETRKNA